jgi:hypothetical protein
MGVRIARRSPARAALAEGCRLRSDQSQKGTSAKPVLTPRPERAHRTWSTERRRNPDTRLLQERNADARLVLRFHNGRSDQRADPAPGEGGALARQGGTPRRRSRRLLHHSTLGRLPRGPGSPRRDHRRGPRRSDSRGMVGPCAQPGSLRTTSTGTSEEGCRGVQPVRQARRRESTTPRSPRAE